MKEESLCVSLSVLRVIRGWSQEELARHSGVRPSSISDYERGKIVPGAGTLFRMIDAMGYPFSALDGAGALIQSLQAESALRLAARLDTGSDRPAFLGGPAASDSWRKWEIEQTAVEAGKVATRLTRLFFSLIGARLPPEPAREDESSEDAEANRNAP